MRAFTSLVLLALCATAMAAQASYTRHEVSAGATYTRISSYNPNFGGITGRYTFNIKPELAIESSFTFYPQDKPIVGSQGGRSFAWFTGAKAGVRRQKWGLYGKAEPGFWHFTSVPQWVIPQPFDPAAVTSVNRGRTHFAVDLGGVLEFYPKGKWFLRADVSEILRRDGDDRIREIVTPSAVYVFGFSGGEIHPAISISAAVGYHFGQKHDNAPVAESNLRRLEGGVQYALSNISYDHGFEMMDNSGLGGWSSYYINSHLAMDAAATHFWNKPLTIVSAQDGGNVWQIFAGPKIGVTRERVGAYAKVRPGLVRFAHALNDEAALVTRGAFQPATQFAIDVGGVLELYPRRHWVVRMDFSDVTIHYGARTATYIGEPPFHWPAYWETTLQTSFGFGWRF